MTRRSLLFTAAGTAGLAAAPSNAKRPTICIFSKHMAQFDYNDLGKNAKQIGFEGVDLTVRPKGHVLPERAAEDMPKAADAIKSHGLKLAMITTNLLDDSDPAARPTLSTAARLGVPYWKPGYHRYKTDAVEESVKRVKKATAGLAALSKEYGIQAGFHNHSGDYVGSAVWDIRTIIADLDPRWIGYYFDPAHATIEGGLAGWRISQNIAQSRLKMVALKDFYWRKDGKDGRWKVEWCPMGEGMVDWDRVFAKFAAGGFTGPLTLHVEYHTTDELAAIAKDFEFIRKQVDKAYTSA